MSRRIVLNIGWARAASTAFRQNFLKRHPALFAVDRGQPMSLGPAAVILRHLKMADDAQFQHYAPELRADWTGYQRQIEQPVICLTDEELSIGVLNTGVEPRAIASRCGSLFPGACTLAIVRNQKDAIRSFYALAERQGQTLGLSLSEWTRKFFVEPEGRGFAYLFDYMETLRGYLEWQPSQDIVVLPYDRLESNHTAFYAEVAGALGISQEACTRLPNEIVNASSAPPGPLLEASGRQDSVAARTRGRPEYAPGLEKEIMELFESGNRELAREFQVEFPPPSANPDHHPQVQGA